MTFLYTEMGTKSNSQINRKSCSLYKLDWCTGSWEARRLTQVNYFETGNTFAHAN